MRQVWLAVFVFVAAVSGAAGAEGRPNIVFILADDLGWSDIGPYGSEISTPNLDRLAEGGVRFTQWHNTSKCFPSRATLLTGLYAQQCGMDKKPAKIVNGVTLGEVLRTAGYRTYWAGKHHSTENPVDRGFDKYFGLRDGCCNYFNPGDQREGEGKPARKRPDRAWCINSKLFEPYTPAEKDFYTTDYFTKYALQFIDEGKDEESPFFLYLAYTAPHDPLMAWPEDIAKYDGKYDAGYEVIRERRYERQKSMGLIDGTFPLSPTTHRPWKSLSEEERKDEQRKMAVYAAMIDRMDQNIGKVLAKLEEIGQLENTLIMFAADNGASAEVVTSGDNFPGTGEIGSMTRWASLGPDWANVGNTPYRYYKNYSHEGGICTPFIVNWPQFFQSGAAYKPGAVIHGYPGHFIDVMPTLVEITGAKYPAEFGGMKIHPMPGESFLPVLKGKKSERENPLYFQWARGRAVRNGDWKLVSFAHKKKQDPATAPWELYNLAKDRTETRDLASERPDLVKELAELYQVWFERVTGN